MSNKNDIFFQDWKVYPTQKYSNSLPRSQSIITVALQKDFKVNTSSDEVDFKKSTLSDQDHVQKQPQNTAIFGFLPLSTPNSELNTPNIHSNLNLGSPDALFHSEVPSPTQKSLCQSLFGQEHPNQKFYSIHDLIGKLSEMIGIHSNLPDKPILFIPTQKNRLGKGRCSNVYLGKVEGVAGNCAIKVIEEELIHAIKEAFILTTIMNWYPHQTRILKILTVQTENSGYIDLDGNISGISSIQLALEYCSKGNIMDYIKRRKEKCGARRFIKWSKNIAEAISFLHSQKMGYSILHNDIKPQNILLDEFLEIKLADFEMAQFIKDGQICNDGFGKGTQFYTAPEIITPPFNYSIPSDIYSLGCTFYAILTGREPFNSTDIYAPMSPVHLIYSIQAGFFESALNPLLAVKSETVVDHPPLTPMTPLLESFNPIHTKPHHEILFRFMNGETLFNENPHALHSFQLIEKLLKGCTALDPSKRMNIKQVMDLLAVLDDFVMPGTGFEEL